ncbi:serine/threonine-protein kinase [Microbacterium sp. CFBP9034]|uniref:serine/threonine-protein kinase n=1 Tax=Microbacterium sp. CFBP9034 TaxID=3096540 RepID=UPI002A6A7E70|nr:protein kinase [Microbacterium sp. CFBP9034]MDY0910461.1 protein kinase [Microbacterium sp. CFBP9034]
MGDTEVGETAPLLDGRYRLGECVGEGGMARVYRAEDVVLGRTVAIKLIRPGVDGASSERARSEMTVLASLNHPSLVTLFDASLVPGKPEYLAMEFVDGPTLGARLASGALPPAMVAHLAAELAEALHVVHAAGIVHRDIKPSNVLLSPAQLPGARPRAKLADFGIAYLLDASRLTSPGMVIGTVAYLAPEQIRGGEPAPASDIYALGLVLLEALTGEREHPHGGGMAAALARLENPPTVPVSLGGRWGDLLTRMLQSDPAARPTALDVATAAAGLAEQGSSDAVPATETAATVPLTAATLIAPAAGLAATPAVASADPRPPSLPSTLPDQPARRRRRRLITTVVGALAAVAVALAAVIGFSALGGPGQTPDPALTVPADTDPSEAPAEDDGTGNEVVVEDPGMTEEERKAADEAQKKAEREQKKLEEEQRKQAEEEQKKLEDEQKRLDNEERKGEEDDG